MKNKKLLIKATFFSGSVFLSWLFKILVATFKYILFSFKQPNEIIYHAKVFKSHLRAFRFGLHVLPMNDIIHFKPKFPLGFSVRMQDCLFPSFHWKLGN